MDYRCEATSVSGFVQMLACNYLPHGYWWYVTGRVPAGRDPRGIDAKLIARYGIDVSRFSRSRRKLAGLANLHYLRHEEFWILLATKGHHVFYEREGEQVRYVRQQPILFRGYSLSVKQGQFLKKESPDAEPVPDSRLHARVQIARERYEELSAYCLEMATHRPSGEVAAALYNVPFEPYAPVRKQMLNLLRMVNKCVMRLGWARFRPRCSATTDSRCGSSTRPGTKRTWRRKRPVA